MPKQSSLNDAQKQQIVELWPVMSGNDIAEKLGTTAGIVYHYSNKYGLKKTSEQISRSQKKASNDRFYQNASPQEFTGACATTFKGGHYFIGT